MLTKQGLGFLALIFVSTGFAVAAPVVLYGKDNAVFKEQRFESWSLSCAQNQPTGCALTQRVSRDAAGLQVVLGAAVKVTTVPDRRLRLELRMSPLAMVEAGIGLKLDKGDELRLRMSDCDDKSCLASGWLTDELLLAMDKAQVAQVAFFMPGRNQVTAPLALAGLKQGVAALLLASKP